ncbi:hypothetical protein V6N11_068821 [Hibiscus sabdariffa]|uniref:Uncharacterized protein n=1 Tax=Hibiscus sabdariffa TaxID=183260 RepID=A0ABR2PAV3_9ROSI
MQSLNVNHVAVSFSDENDNIGLNQVRFHSFPLGLGRQRNISRVLEAQIPNFAFSGHLARLPRILSEI